VAVIIAPIRKENSAHDTPILNKPRLSLYVPAARKGT
jgi:hypothetical protein